MRMVPLGSSRRIRAIGLPAFHDHRVREGELGLALSHLTSERASVLRDDYRTNVLFSSTGNPRAGVRALYLGQTATDVGCHREHEETCGHDYEDRPGRRRSTLQLVQHSGRYAAPATAPPPPGHAAAR